MIRRGRLPALVLGGALLAAAGLLAPAGPAGAVGGGELGSGGTGTGTSGSSTATVVHSCTLYANSVGFGAWCGGGSSGRARTWRQLLQGNPFVPCRDDPVPAGVLTPPDPPGGGGWWMRTCLENYDLNAVDGGHARPVTSLTWVPAGQPLYTTIPWWMVWLWAEFERAYPTPVLSVGPIAIPRVNVPAYFWLAGPAATPLSEQVYDGTGTITMQARLRGLTVHPGISAGEPGIDCGAGTTGYDYNTDPFHQSSTCTVTYHRSSADRTSTNHSYLVRADAVWEVGWTDAGGGWHTLGSFDVGSLQLVPVQEVQAIQTLN